MSAASAVRLVTRAFRKMLCRWTLIVPSVSANLRATSLLLNPAETRLVISCSRELNEAVIASGSPDEGAGFWSPLERRRKVRASGLPERFTAQSNARQD